MTASREIFQTFLIFNTSMDNLEMHDDAAGTPDVLSASFASRHDSADHPPQQDNWGGGIRDTYIDALARMMERGPDRVFLDFSGQCYTYADFDLLSTRFARSLEQLGVQRGDTVVTMLDNNIDAIVAWFAISKLCAVSVPLNTALRGEFLRHQIADAGPAIICCEAEYTPRIAAIANALDGAPLILQRGVGDPGLQCRLPIRDLDAHRGSDSTPLESRPRPGDLAALIYTSGTTGPSKGCMLSYNYLCNVARQQLAAAPAGADDVVWTPLPFFHMNAMATGLISTLLVGARLAIAPRFSVSGFWPAVQASGATVVSILGSMGNMLARAPDNDAMAHCRGQVHTVRGNPFPEDIKDIWRSRFGALRVGSNGYGLTEAACITSLAAGEYAAPGSSGKRIADFDVRIFDENGNELPPGQVGEVVCRPRRPDIMFQGYWRRPGETQSIMRDMWLYCGDMGKFDADGFFYFVDRKKDYLRRRGENISSFEMEAAFMKHHDIVDVAVHAVPSPVGEDDVKVTAVLRPGAALTEADLCRWAIDQVPYYAVPRYIEFRQVLPRNPQGKVLKYLLREEGVTGATWDIESSGIVVAKR